MLKRQLNRLVQTNFDQVQRVIRISVQFLDMSFWKRIACCFCCRQSEGQPQVGEPRTKPISQANLANPDRSAPYQTKENHKPPQKNPISYKTVNNDPQAIVHHNHPDVNNGDVNIPSTQNISANPYPSLSRSDPEPPNEIHESSINPIVTHQSPRTLPTENSEEIRVTIQTINKELKELTVNRHITGAKLKQLVFTHVCQSLDVSDMTLSYEGTIIGNNKKLSDLRIVVGSQLKIVQGKIDLGEVASIIADVHGIDLISDEQGTARMGCGHNIGRDTMTALVRSLVSIFKYEIRCPYLDENGQTCNALWEFKDCRRVGVFTREEVEEFEAGLSVNWIKENTKVCPNPSCRQQICKKGLKTNRVRCPSCKYGDFCYICLNKWTGSSSDFCGSEQCRFKYFFSYFRHTFVASCPWDHILKMKDKSDNNVLKEYALPRYRACPNCCMAIEHIAGCKHMLCKACGKNFCWVCLSMRGSQGWSCGLSNQYCGKVAQIQSILAK